MGWITSWTLLCLPPVKRKPAGPGSKSHMAKIRSIEEVLKYPTCWTLSKLSVLCRHCCTNNSFWSFLWPPRAAKHKTLWKSDLTEHGNSCVPISYPLIRGVFQIKVPKSCKRRGNSPLRSWGLHWFIISGSTQCIVWLGLAVKIHTYEM